MTTLNLGVASSMGGRPAREMTGAHTDPVDTDAQTAAAPRPVEAAAEWVAPSWDDIVRTHADRVYRLAYRLSGNRADAEDLTQETFVRVFRSLADYTPGTFEGWLHRITTNLFLDMARRRQKIRFDALADDAGDRLASDEPGPERAYEQNNLDPEIQRALDALPADFRAAVVLCDLEGLTYEEIALTLGIKVGTVRSRIHRGRVLLREALAHRAPGVRPIEYGSDVSTHVEADVQGVGVS
ncbi:MAG: polymerase sigma factor SigE [Frankiales bacterium]|jgi:RNA polymerase sigma-70 factor (ECF subfamily)|nr:polymerase sigma factor SigE [Frankiales bacterium]